MQFIGHQGLCYRVVDPSDYQSGGQAIVWQAEDPDGGAVAVKQANADPHDRKRIAAERDELRRLLESAADLAEVVVPILDWGETASGSPFLVLPWLPVDLGDWLGAGRPLLARARAASAVCAAVVRLHRREGVIHRDLKPQNVLMRSLSEESPLVLLADFGGSRREGGSRSRGSGFHSEAYAPPDQVLPLKPHRSWDTYALGVLVYECVVGLVPDGVQAASYRFLPAGHKLAALHPRAQRGRLSGADATEYLRLKGLPVDALVDVAGVDPLDAGDRQRLREVVSEVLPDVSGMMVADGLLDALSEVLQGDPGRRSVDGGGLKNALRQLVRALERAEKTGGVRRRPDSGIGQSVDIGKAGAGGGSAGPAPDPIPVPAPSPVHAPAPVPSHAPRTARVPTPAEPASGGGALAVGKWGAGAAVALGLMGLWASWGGDGPAPRPENVVAPVAVGQPSAPANPPASRAEVSATTIEWVRIPGGVFEMGSEGGDDDEKPLHTVSVPSFELMKTEVTVGQYRSCVEAGACTALSGKSPSEYCNWGHSDRDEHPINCVDWAQAQSFARWAGGRLPSEAEWEFAARSGGNPWAYPWGNEPATCSRAVLVGGGNGCGQDRTWPVCSRPSGNSTHGVCDLSGNVWEWVLDTWHDSYTGAPGEASAWEGDASNRVFRGGGWLDSASYLRASYRRGYDPTVRYNNLGFRLAR